MIFTDQNLGRLHKILLKRLRLGGTVCASGDSVELFHWHLSMMGGLGGPRAVHAGTSLGAAPRNVARLA
jgi:hypothetical protein